MTPKFSIVTPVYGSPQSLPELVRRIGAVMARLDASFEIIMVDDRCPQGSWAVLEDLAAAHPEIVAVRLSRNFGQHPAIFAGLELVRGEWVVVMDCDLQDEPETIEELFAQTEHGFDIVRARRIQRQDSYFRRQMSWLFYSVLTFLTGVRQSEEIANFGVYHRRVVDQLLSWNETHRYFPAIVQWIGFSVCDHPVSHAKRKFGQSSYTFKRLFDLALGIIVSFSDKPLRIMASTGLVISMLSIILSVVLLLAALVGMFQVPGWASIVVSLWFLSGVVILTIGISGIYLGQVLRESKGRPIFVVDRVIKRENEV